MEHSQPLSEEEFDELDRFLLSESVPEACMDISMLDGFLTALLIGPNMVTPSRWLALVWGETPERPMPWDSPQQANRMTSLVLRHMNEILWQLTEEPEHYEPLLFEHDREDGPVVMIDEWCTGFIRGAMLDGEAWKPLFDSVEHQDLLLPIFLYGTEEGWQDLEAKPELAERHDEFVDSLSDSVLAIQDFWLPIRKAKSTIRHSAPTPGRNDPCPCGSGLKFKKCCGGAAKLN